MSKVTKVAATAVLAMALVAPNAAYAKVDPGPTATANRSLFCSIWPKSFFCR